MPFPVIVIFDIGKTNKKVLLFDRHYKLVLEETARFEEITDEDGFPCEDIDNVLNWIREKLDTLFNNTKYDIRAVNFSAYGASFVHLGNDLSRLAPLYNYLKPYPEHLKQQFYDRYGGENLLARQTASPVLGSLNSGMQLYRIKYEKPSVFQRIRYSLHLPQYLSFNICGTPTTDISSVGCHTHLWDFGKNDYHEWVYREGMETKFAPLYNGNKIIGHVKDHPSVKTGIGLHDSSAALIPYLTSFREPFVLLSTGTWNISLNPFNNTPLSDAELKQDCLCYLSYEGTPVKASRLFAGFMHEQEVKRLDEHFNKHAGYYKTVDFDPAHLKGDIEDRMLRATEELVKWVFPERELSSFDTYEQAYHALMADIVLQQVRSTRLVLEQNLVKRIFVDGGFGKNTIFMRLLALHFPGTEIFAATIPQASAIGAALAIHADWNLLPLPPDLIELKYYSNQEMNYSQ